MDPHGNKGGEEMGEGGGGRKGNWNLRYYMNKLSSGSKMEKIKIHK